MWGKNFRKTRLWLIFLPILLLSSCKKEFPVGQLPVNQVSAGQEGTTNSNQDNMQNAEQKDLVPVTEVTIYLPNEMADGFLTSSMLLPDTPEAIIQQMVKEGVLAEGVQVLHFDCDEGILDLSEEYGLELQNIGASGELLMLGCVVNTFLEHYDMDSIMLYVEGKVIETGHNTYDEPIGFVELE